jgi:YihY family inner membrane protein
MSSPVSNGQPSTSESDFEAPVLPSRSRFSGWRQTARFLSQTESHVYALSISASVLLSFFPFLIVISSICRYSLHWPAAVDAINLALMDYFPAEVGTFLVRNLSAAVSHNGPTQVISIVLLLFTANGVFEPLEVALNRVWGVGENRSYIKNQILSFGLILFCGALVMGSLLLTAQNQELARELFHLDSLPGWLTWILFKLAAVPITVFALFVVYWALPNRRVPAKPLISVSIFIGIALEIVKYLFLFMGPVLITKLQREYGPFHNSVAILLLSFVSAMVVLAGAEWSARRVD